MKDELGKTLADATSLPELSMRRVLKLIPVAIAATVVLVCDNLYWAIFDKEERN